YSADPPSRGRLGAGEKDAFRRRKARLPISSIRSFGYGKRPAGNAHRPSGLFARHRRSRGQLELGWIHGRVGLDLRDLRSDTVRSRDTDDGKWDLDSAHVTVILKDRFGGRDPKRDHAGFQVGLVKKPGL